MIVRPFMLIVRRLAGLWRPAHRLAQLTEQAHRGEISIEEMTSAAVARGHLKPLAKSIGQILLDLKQQCAHRAGLEQEIRDRIANRTDALERRIGSLQLQVLRDPLTGLGNRRALDAEIARAVQQHQSASIDTALLMIDVDHFKPLNDTLGHAAGDQLLREIGQLIHSALRGKDVAFRCGGDEFVVLLHGCNFHTGTAVAGRLEALVRHLTKPLRVATPPQLSIGVCAISDLEAPSSDSLLKTADERLYAVKSNRPGRERRRSA